MSIPAEDVAATDSSDTSQAESSSETLTFEQRVNQVIDSADLDTSGNIILPTDVPEDIKFAARAEKRRRDTQSALAKAKGQLSVAQIENEELKKLAQQGKRIELSPEEHEELNELKNSDPDAWRERMNILEQNAADTVNTKLSEISETAQTKGSLGERQVLLDAFQQDNPELVINDDVLTNDIPPRITRALESGDISFMEFLGKVKEYLETGKVVQNSDIPPQTPNLSDIGGSDIPGDNAEKGDSEVKYEKMIF
jgi:hypothetical protein